MAVTPDGDPPDPSNANIPRNAQSTNTPVVHSAKTGSILTKNDGETRYFVIVNEDDDDATTLLHDGSPTTTILTNDATLPPDSTINALSSPSPGVHRAKHDSVPTIIDQVSATYDDRSHDDDKTKFVSQDNNTWDTSWSTVSRKCKRITTKHATSSYLNDSPDADIQMIDTNTNDDNPDNPDNHDNQTLVSDNTTMRTDALTNRTPKTTTTASSTWTPIKIGWNMTIPAGGSIHDPNITNNPVDDHKTSQHPFIAKL
eukprot:CAMPEP_0201164518 /NCGR_PEP_ID=MMETSP0851-20130426/61300_1 /ASSEMBLY_ACC=CAM_ASM_000631 /TAXON_ID=183588 /ORGANISM="Pseudo-nitzschia fraudulenta, Strain WWA7" /LENGTH=256 /DNA_ID=CAMNT_0047444985 /DNA_START=31 /DNA_END=798 /DNA_ORIENTATION=-